MSLAHPKITYYLHALEKLGLFICTKPVKINTLCLEKWHICSHFEKMAPDDHKNKKNLCIQSGLGGEN